jgi:hypothetical protein
MELAMNAISPNSPQPAETLTNVIPPFYMFSDVAKALGMSSATLERVVDRGDLPMRYLAGRRIIFADDLRNYLANLPDWQTSPWRGGLRGAHMSAASTPIVAAE